jgi:CDP-glucose 4,6-dehydratase
MVVREAIQLWGEGAAWRPAPTPDLHEAMVLRLDATKAKDRLDWGPRLGFDQAIAWTIDWYRQWQAGARAEALCGEQIRRYLAAGR